MLLLCKKVTRLKFNQVCGVRMYPPLPICVEKTALTVGLIFWGKSKKQKFSRENSRYNFGAKNGVFRLLHIRAKFCLCFLSRNAVVQIKPFQRVAR